MGNLWLKIKIWTKVSLFALLTLYILLFAWNNNSKPVSPWLWFWGKDSQTTVLVLVLSAFLTGVVGTILVSTTLKTLGQVRELRSRTRLDRLERAEAERAAKAGKLRTRPEASDAPIDSEP